MIRCEGYSVGCVLVGLEARDADYSEKDNEDMDGQKVDRLIELLEKLLQMQGSEEGEDEDPENEYELAARKETPKPDTFGKFKVTSTEGSGKGDFVNPVSARDALQHLKGLRGFIEASGNRKATDAFNSAVKTIKAQIAASDSYESSHPQDVRSKRQADGAAFERSAARFHGKKINVHQQPNAVEDDRKAEDAARQEETFDQAVERVRQEQIDRWTPKRRR